MLFYTFHCNHKHNNTQLCLDDHEHSMTLYVFLRLLLCQAFISWFWTGSENLTNIDTDQIHETDLLYIIWLIQFTLFVDEMLKVTFSLLFFSRFLSLTLSDNGVKLNKPLCRHSNILWIYLAYQEQKCRAEFHIIISCIYKKF